MKPTLFYSVIFFTFGLAILIFPQMIVYFDTSNFFFDFAKFLLDYPQFTMPIGIIMITVGIVSFVHFIITERQENTAFVIQKASYGYYGDTDLHFPKAYIGNRDELIYESIITTKNFSRQFIELETERIDRFYGNLGKKKRIDFLGISPMPSLVYAGYVVGDSGKSVNYFHWDRNKMRAFKINKKNGRISCCCIEKEDKDCIVGRKSNDYVLCISTSYEINKDIVKKQFSTSNLLFFKSSIIGTESIKSSNDILAISQKIREIIDKIPCPEATIHLLLSCSAELCFGIGRKLHSQALPKILVYNFNRQGENHWDWYINLN